MHDFRFSAPCRLWWHVKSQKIRMAFVDKTAAHADYDPLDVDLEWDIDLVTFGISWPDFIEDKMLASLVRWELSNYDEGNPLTFDLGEVEDAQKEEKAAIIMQRTARGKFVRAVLRAQMAAKLQKAAMESREIAALEALAASQ